MRILDTGTDAALQNIILYLKVEEAKEIYDSIGVLFEKINFNCHTHVNDVSFEHEITIVLYDEQQIESLNERIEHTALPQSPVSP